MKRKLLHYLALAMCVLILLLPLGVHVLRLYRIEQSWHSAGVSFKQTSLEQARASLEKQGVDTAMPGNGNAALTFQAPFGLMLRDAAYNNFSFARGDTLESDFVTWSNDFFRERMVRLTVNGRKYSARISTGQLTMLYQSALEQNGLAEQFQADTGHRLNYFSAKKAIRQLDKTLFEQGIHKAYDYPYDRRRVELILGLSVIFCVPLAGLLLTLASLAGEAVQYQLWLREYNREHTKNWAKLSGNLPQFVSLRESGLDRPVPIHRKLRLRDRFAALFLPGSKGGRQ